MVAVAAEDGKLALPRSRWQGGRAEIRCGAAFRAIASRGARSIPAAVAWQGARPAACAAIWRSIGLPRGGGRLGDTWRTGLVRPSLRLAPCGLVIRFGLPSLAGGRFIRRRNRGWCRLLGWLDGPAAGLACWRRSSRSRFRFLRGGRAGCRRRRHLLFTLGYHARRTDGVRGVIGCCWLHRAHGRKHAGRFARGRAWPALRGRSRGLWRRFADKRPRSSRRFMGAGIAAWRGLPHCRLAVLRLEAASVHSSRGLGIQPADRPRLGLQDGLLRGRRRRRLGKMNQEARGRRRGYDQARQERNQNRMGNQGAQPQDGLGAAACLGARSSRQLFMLRQQISTPGRILTYSKFSQDW
jgi:hypothetical protein